MLIDNLVYHIFRDFARGFGKKHRELKEKPDGWLSVGADLLRVKKHDLIFKAYKAKIGGGEVMTDFCDKRYEKIVNHSRSTLGL